MSARLPVRKTYKLFIGGAFPRSESGRTYEAEGQNVARASRKDVRDAVRAARAAFPKWAGMTAYNRGQVLYRLAEMIESRAAEFAELCTGREEVERSIDRVVWYAGWADKLAQVLGASNPVAGPYFNFTLPEPTGVVGVVAPDEPPLLGIVSRVAPVIVGGNTAVVLASEDAAARGDRARRGDRDVGRSRRRRQRAHGLPLGARAVARGARRRQRARHPGAGRRPRARGRRQREARASRGARTRRARGRSRPSSS